MAWKTGLRKVRLKVGRKRLAVYGMIVLVGLIVGLELASRRCEFHINYGRNCWDIAEEVIGPEKLVQLSKNEVELNWDEVIANRVFEVSRGEIGGNNGIACIDYAFVANDLPLPAKKYVAAHEALHIMDYELSETSINYRSGKKEPVGLVSTVGYSLKLSLENGNKVPLREWPCVWGRIWTVFKAYFLGIGF